MTEKKEFMIKVESWQNEMNKFKNSLTQCVKHIKTLTKQLNEINSLLKNQEKDDLLFYEGLLNLVIQTNKNFIHIIKKKIISDLNFNFNKIKKCSIKIHSLDEFNYITKTYIEIANEIYNSQNNKSQSINWVKDDNIKCLKDFEISIMKALEYHNKLIEHILELLNIQINFYS